MAYLNSKEATVFKKFLAWAGAQKDIAYEPVMKQFTDMLKSEGITKLSSVVLANGLRDIEDKKISDYNAGGLSLVLQALKSVKPREITDDLVSKLPEKEWTKFRDSKWVKEHSMSAKLVTAGLKIRDGKIAKAELIKELWIVTKPGAESIFEDVCFKTDFKGLRNLFLGGLKPEEIEAVFTTEGEATALAKKLLAAKPAK